MLKVLFLSKIYSACHLDVNGKIGRGGGGGVFGLGVRVDVNREVSEVYVKNGGGVRSGGGGGGGGGGSQGGCEHRIEVLVKSKKKIGGGGGGGRRWGGGVRVDVTER